jgi:CubicO group peptidase (beta-lactamase class C family)
MNRHLQSTIHLLVVLSAPGSLNAQTPPLRLDPVESVIRDLQKNVPDEMLKAGTPGLAIALIRDHRVVWEKGFGVTNTVTREPVDSTTMFPAASLGKPIVAFAALRLVSRGRLELDLPLDMYLSNPWLSDSSDRARITMRHVLTHTSGLSNFLGDRNRVSKSPPGTQYSYSGLGFMYLQTVLEHETGMPLDCVATSNVLRPLGVQHTWFGSDFEIRGLKANGHLTVSRAVAPFAIIFLPFLVIAVVLAAGGTRVVRGTWNPPGWIRYAAVGAAIAGTIIFLISRASSPGLIPFFVASFFVFVAPAFGMIALIECVVRRLVTVSRGRLLLVRTVLSLVILAGLFLVTRDMRVPVPDVPPPTGNAASSLTSTAGDLGRFLIALANPEGLTPELARACTQPQVSVSDHIHWGLGIGIQTDDAGPALFHWGRNPGVRAAMVYYPATGTGVVVLANDGRGGDEVADIAVRAIGGSRFWADE